MSSHRCKQHAQRQLDDLISNTARPLNYTKQPFLRLIHAMRATSRILAPQQDRCRHNAGSVQRIIIACLRMSNLLHLWVRPPEAWNAPDASPFVQFRAFVNHLFARYPVPNLIAPAWLVDDHDLWLIDLYLHLAAGRGIRQFSQLNWLQITKRMACWFMNAPDDLHLLNALRWAQVRSLGGDERLARLLSSCILHDAAQDEPFWESVICFLIQNQPISDEEVIAIVRFIFLQRFQAARVVVGPECGLDPLQPEFSLAGRSLMSLRRHMANWRNELGITQRPSRQNNLSWEKTGIGPFSGRNDQGVWTIEELLTGEDLIVEGMVMRHCVASYVHSCARRRTSIWSMKLQQVGQPQRVLTLEITPETKTICQAKGKYNTSPSESGRKILQQWANQEGLTLDETI